MSARDLRACLRLVCCALLALVVFASCPEAHADVTSCLDAAEAAQASRRRGQLIEAKQGFIACAAAACPTQVRADCTRWLAEIEQALPTVVVRVHDEAGRDVADALLTLDDQRATLDGRPLDLDPGRHVLRVSAPGRRDVSETIVVRQSERDRVVSIALPSMHTRAPTAHEGAPIPIVSWVLGGAGVAALGTGAVLAVVGSSEHADLEASCAQTGSCSQGDITSARTKLIAGDILMAAGIVAIGVGLYLALTRSPRAALSSPSLIRF